MTRLPPVLLVLVSAGCGLDELSYKENEYVGEAAKNHLSLCKQDELPTSMTDLWVYDGGSFNGMIYYVSFKCQTLDDCWSAVRAFGAPEQSRFSEGIQTKFAVNQDGPSFYHEGYDPQQWDISAVKNGVFYETARGNDFMDFWAIDRDRLRVYFHHESGGFPDDPPTTRNRPGT